MHWKRTLLRTKSVVFVLNNQMLVAYLSYSFFFPVYLEKIPGNLKKVCSLKMKLCFYGLHP